MSIRDSEPSKLEERISSREESSYGSFLADFTTFSVSGIFAIFFGLQSLRQEYYGNEGSCILLRKWTVPCFIFHSAFAGLILLFFVFVIISQKVKMPIPVFRIIIYLIGLLGFLLFYFAIAVIWGTTEPCGTLSNWVNVQVIIGSIGIGLFVLLCIWISCFMGFASILESFGFHVKKEQLKDERQIKEKKEELKVNYQPIEDHPS